MGFGFSRRHFGIFLFPVVVVAFLHVSLAFFCDI